MCTETKWSIQKLESYQKTAGQSISCNKPRRATEAVGRRFHRDYPKRQMILVTELHWHRLLQNVFYWTSTKRWRRLKMKRYQYCSWNREEPVKRARLDPAPFCSRNLLSGCLRWRSCWSCARGLQPATGSICSHLHSDLAVHPLYNNPRFDFRSTPWILSDSSPNITTSKRYLGFHDSAQITRETEHIVEVNLLTEREERSASLFAHLCFQRVESPSALPVTVLTPLSLWNYNHSQSPTLTGNTSHQMCGEPIQDRRSECHVRERPIPFHSCAHTYQHWPEIHSNPLKTIKENRPRERYELRINKHI